jgi:hypothetical protein
MPSFWSQDEIEATFSPEYRTTVAGDTGWASYQAKHRNGEVDIRIGGSDEQ